MVLSSVYVDILQITSHKLALEDAASDSFVFHLKALAHIAAKHGEHSDEYKAASKLLDRVVKQVKTW